MAGCLFAEAKKKKRKEMDKTGAAWKTRRLNRGSALKTKQVFFNNVKGKKPTHARTKKRGNLLCKHLRM